MFSSTNRLGHWMPQASNGDAAENDHEVLFCCAEQNRNGSLEVRGWRPGEVYLQSFLL